MKFCNADFCPDCSLSCDVPACLRRKAQFAITLTQVPSASGIRAALEKLSSYLLDEAAALEKETALFAITTESSTDASSTSGQAQADGDRLGRRRVAIN
jgi:hypothetical protein